MFLHKTFTLIGFLILSFSLQSQSLLEDTEKFIEALSVLDKSDAHTADSILQAKAEILAVLSQYSQYLDADKTASEKSSEITNAYANNFLIKNILDDQKLVLDDSFGTHHPQVLEAAVDSVQSGPRNKILRLLNAQNAISPADYLSVRNTLETYSTPPISSATALKISAENSNSGVSKGVLFSQAAIIEGLFTFVLERAKDEVIINFLERMLTPRDSAAIQQLFPTVIEEFGEAEVSYSTSYIERLRQAFYTDIQTMSVRLPSLMLSSDYFQSIQSDPIAYNILAIYTMIGMSQDDVPFDEIIPVTHRYLYGTREEAVKDVNLQLAESPVSDPRNQKLIHLSDTVITQMVDVYLALNNAESAIQQKVSDNSSFANDSIPTPAITDYLDKDAYGFDKLLGFDSKDGFDLSLLPYLLQGKLDSAYISKYNTLESYDKFFGKERKPKQWRAAGLELARKLDGSWYNDQSIAAILLEWQQDLVSYSLSVDDWARKVNPQEFFTQDSFLVELNKLSLNRAIQGTKRFWSDDLTHDENLALNALVNLTDNTAFSFIEDDIRFLLIRDLRERASKKLSKKKDYLVDVQSRMIDLEKRIAARNPKHSTDSPFHKYRENTTMSSSPYEYIVLKIDGLSNSIDSVQAQLSLLENTFAKNKSRARDNATPVLQTTEIVTQLTYCLRSNQEDHQWITNDELTNVLDGGLKQNVFLGLMTQKLSNINGLGPLSPEGIAQFVQLTVKDLDLLPSFQPSNDSLAVKDSLAFYHKASFFVNTLNRVLQLPLIVEPGFSGNFKPLTEQRPALAEVPKISSQLLNFVYYLHTKENSKALSTMIRLFTGLFEQDTTVTAGMAKEKAPMQYLVKYGDFIAGLVDAREADEVKDLLDHIAAPPGSSSTKRTKQLTVGLNAYLGINAGYENWTSQTAGIDDDSFVNVTATMPIGFVISDLLSKKKHSFSLFVSLIDLGGLLDYRQNSTNFGDNQITFKNVFKPGFQVHWNIPKSPFYLGAGTHFGNQYREVNDVSIGIPSKRFFLAFGIDVPLFILYQR